ncbi:MAG: aspartate/glutamate racemase family protein [Spirochaetales bacterium]|jgi:Asp/Glu/hydantoin racemase|nr:aspartate/glutamate racemase family protein [Spirochaetales bacterium]
MLYKVKPGQVSYGEAIGILLLENYAPFIPGDTANATTYSYPVRFQRVPGLSVERIFKHDLSMYTKVKESALELKKEGVRAITGDCGFMAIYQWQLVEDLGIPVFHSSLLQLPFMSLIIGKARSIGVITANSKSLTRDVFSWAGVTTELQKRLTVRGLEDCDAFADAAIRETGELDSAALEAGVVERALELQEQDTKLGAILLECSMLPPYGAAVQEATGLPVFDFVTMINFVHSTVVKECFRGSM